MMNKFIITYIQTQDFSYQELLQSVHF